MSLSAEQANAMVLELATDGGLLHQIVHGGPEATIETEGGTVKSVARAVAEGEAAFAAATAGIDAAVEAALDEVEGAIGVPVAAAIAAAGEAETARDAAAAWAETAEDTEVEAGQYSALHHKAKALAAQAAAESARDEAEDIRDSLVNTVQLMGEFDASTGTFPADPEIGHEWIVTVSGTVGAFDLVSGDEIIYGPSGWFVVGRGLTAGEILTLILSVDGTGSGLDADKLDGQEGAYYRDASNLNAGELPAARFGDTAHGARAGGSLHALATTGAAGFMSAADKIEIAALRPLAETATLTFVMNGGGAVLTTGVKGDLEVPFACTIVAVTALADQAGSAVVDVWKDTYANFPPVDADSITASAPVTLSAAAKSRNVTLTGWTTAIAAGDVLRFNVDSAATITKLTISIKVVKS